MSNAVHSRPEIKKTFSKVSELAFLGLLDLAQMPPQEHNTAIAETKKSTASGRAHRYFCYL